MDQVHQVVEPTKTTPLADQLPLQSRGAAPAAPSTEDAAILRGIPLLDATAMLSSGRSMVTDLVLGADNQVAQIRVIDAVTHQVIASSPPDTIARMQREMLAYQQVAQARQSGD